MTDFDRPEEPEAAKSAFRISLAALPRLRAIETADREWCVVSAAEGHIIATRLSHELAILFAASPAMLAFMHSISQRPNAPAAVDASRLYQRFNFEPGD